MLKQSVIDNMKEIAEHCMGEETASCVATCPMHTNVKEYVRLIREGKGEEAIKVIRDQLFYRELWEESVRTLAKENANGTKERAYGDCVLKKICSRSF